MAKKVVACPVETAIEIIGGRWKVLILQELFAGTRRFSELHRALRGVSHRTLTQQLRELETHGIVRRKVHRQIPPKVEYSLTPVGETLKPVIDVMHDWAEGYARKRAAKPKARAATETKPKD